MGVQYYFTAPVFHMKVCLQVFRSAAAKVKKVESSLLWLQRPLCEI